ncbi:hypothetical protein EI94DRAFT_1825659 [Lactarius quietus]|nr:hypothetical protein EI94DRAFT_1825659 [Lactarius quietus]
MPNSESSSPYIPRPQHYPVQGVEVLRPTATHESVPWNNGQQPGMNYPGPCYCSSGANYGNWTYYRSNLWNEGPPPPSQAANVEGPYVYQGNPYVGYAPPGNDQHYPAPPGPPPGYHIPPAHGIQNGGLAPPIAIPDIADPFTQNVPNYDPFRTSAMEDLKRTATRYLCNPDSRVDVLHTRLSTTGTRRFKVMILLEVDDI